MNEVLNNTKPLGSSGQTDEYPTLGGGILGSDNVAEVLGYGDLGMGQNKERAREMAAVDSIKKSRCISRPSSRRCSKCIDS